MVKYLLTTLVFLTACQQVGRPSPPSVPTTNLKDICTLEDVELSKDEHLECAQYFASLGAYLPDADEADSEMLCQHAEAAMHVDDDTRMIEEVIGLNPDGRLDYCF